MYVADPRALQHILQKGGYTYKKPTGDGAANALLGGRGLSWAEGEFFFSSLKCTAYLAIKAIFINVTEKLLLESPTRWLFSLSSTTRSKRL